MTINVHRGIFILFLLVGHRSQCQPILDYSNATPESGETFVRYDCGVTRYTNGPDGPGVAWDFADLSSTFTDTISYQACSGTLCDSFPGTALLSVNNGNYLFYSSDTSSLATLGNAFSNLNTDYTIPEKTINYPAVFNVGVREVFLWVQPATGNSGFGYDSLFADAFGSLRLPTGVYSNVLRIHNIHITSDSSISSSGAVSRDSNRTDIYSWYQPGFHSPLLSMYYDFTTLNGLPELAETSYFAILPAAAPDVRNDVSDLQVYPNPAIGQLNIEVPNSSSDCISTIEILNIWGTVEFSEQKEFGIGIKQVAIELPRLSAGVYFLRVTTMGNSLVKKILIEN